MPHAEIAGKMVRSTAQSVGLDLFATEEVLIPPQEQRVVPTGVHSDLVECFALIVDRSGLAAKFGVGRLAGLIDPDYTGEWKVVLVNFCGKEPFVVRKGDRIAQAVFFDQQQVWNRVFGPEVIVKKQERTDGFGSTGN